MKAQLYGYKESALREATRFCFVFGFLLNSCLQESFYFGFYFCALAVPRAFSLSLLSGIFNKVPSFTHFGCFKVVIHMRSCRFLHAAVYCSIFHLILVTPKITKFILKLQLFILCMLVFFQNFLTCLRGPKKFIMLLLFFWTDSVFCCFEHSFEYQTDSL